MLLSGWLSSQVQEPYFPDPWLYTGVQFPWCLSLPSQQWARGAAINTTKTPKYTLCVPLPSSGCFSLCVLSLWLSLSTYTCIHADTHPETRTQKVKTSRLFCFSVSSFPALIWESKLSLPALPFILINQGMNCIHVCWYFNTYSHFINEQIKIPVS